MKKNTFDVSIIGSGPNGLAAAITCAQAGLSVVVYEAKSTVGGGMRSAELTLPGFTHDICSAIHPLGVGSPFFRSLPLEKHGLEWIYPSACLAHPFSDGSAAILEHSIDATSQTLGGDATAYKKLMEPIATDWHLIVNDLLGPFHIPQHPLAMAKFGLIAIRSAESVLKSRFKEQHARGLFAGMAAHSILPLGQSLTAAFGLILGVLGHVYGWPLAKGGSQNIAKALTSYFLSLGGEIVTGINIASLDQLPPSKAILCDITPKQLLSIAESRLPTSYAQKLQKYRYGPGVCKIDWALSDPIPWIAKECMRAGTVHVCGTADEIIQSEKEVWENKHPDKPYIILAQQSLFDPTRAPKGKHTAWAYCHVPNGSTLDMTDRIESQIERFAPHFRDCIIGRSVKRAVDMETYNPNYIGGDINGGVQDINQLYTRPVARCVPYSTPVPGLYICSSSTPPGGGVHGMCGYHTAQALLTDLNK